MTTETIAKIESFLKEIGERSEIDIDILNMVDIDDIDRKNAYESIYEMIEDKSGFDKEIIYYYRAIEYLSQYDNSLVDSLRIADQMGYELKNLNSELLASLLASENSRSEFGQLESEINDFFAELGEEEE